MEAKVEALCPKTKEDLINAEISVWEDITEETIHETIYLDINYCLDTVFSHCFLSAFYAPVSLFCKTKR